MCRTASEQQWGVCVCVSMEVREGGQEERERQIQKRVLVFGSVNNNGGEKLMNLFYNKRKVSSEQYQQ